MINYKLLAIQNLVPNAVVTIIGDKILWNDERTQPTEEEIAQKIAELEYTEEVEEYKRARELAYPLMSEQLDKIFHEGIDAWKAEIQAVKDAHPKAVIDNDTLEARKSQALFDHQLKKYTEAMIRLDAYIVADGQEEMIESIASDQRVWNPETKEWEDVMIDVVTRQAVDPVSPTITVMSSENPGDEPTEQTIENPAITKDNYERADAQAIVDATPQSVIDTYNE
jgi:hypothetical protein